MTDLPDAAAGSSTDGPAADPLLDAALLVLAERGLKGATTRAIAEHAGVNEVTLFRRYGTKTELIRAAVLRRSGLLRQNGVQYSGNLQADLTRLTREYQNALQNVGPVIRVLVTEFPRHPELKEVLDGPRQLFGEIAALLARYQQEGQLRPEAMTSLLPAFLGPIILPHLTPDIAPLLLQGEMPGADPETHVERFLHGRGRAAEG